MLILPSHDSWTGAATSPPDHDVGGHEERNVFVGHLCQDGHIHEPRGPSLLWTNVGEPGDHFLR